MFKKTTDQQEQTLKDWQLDLTIQCGINIFYCLLNNVSSGLNIYSLSASYKVLSLLQNEYDWKDKLQQVFGDRKSFYI